MVLLIENGHDQNMGQKKMLIKPQKTKYTFFHNLKLSNSFKLNSRLIKYNYGLVACENSILTSAQLSSAILSIKKQLKQNYSLLIRVFPHIGVTKRPPEQPLGKGKSSISYWATNIKTGTVIFELFSYNDIINKLSFINASKKLPFKTKIIIKNGLN